MKPLRLNLPDIPGLRRDLLAMALLATSASAAMGLVGPILPMYLDSIHLDAPTIGLLFSVSAVAVAIGEFSWGWAIDRVPLRLPMTVGTAGLACILLAFAFTWSLPLLFALFFLRGAAFVSTVPVSRAFVGSTIGLHQKALFMALFSTVLGIGRTGGSFAGGSVAESWGYAMVFVVAALVVFGGAAVGLPLLRAGHLTQYTRHPRTEPVRQLLNALPGRHTETASYRAQGIIAVLTFIPFGLTGTFVPLLAKKVLLLQPSDVGLIYAVCGLVGIALTIPAGRLSDGLGRRPLMVTGLLLVGISIAGVAYARNYESLLGFMMLNAFGLAAFSPAAVALLSASAPANRQGTAMGLYGLCEDIGIILGPAIGGFLWEGLGPTPTFWFGAIPTFAAAVIALSAVRRQPISERVAAAS